MLKQNKTMASLPPVSSPDILECPICSFTESNYESLNYHVNIFHLDANSKRSCDEVGPAKERADPSRAFPATEAEWVECSCGEICLLTEFSDHLDLHELENIDQNTNSTALLGTQSTCADTSDTPAGKLQQGQSMADNAYMLGLSLSHAGGLKNDLSTIQSCGDTQDYARVAAKGVTETAICSAGVSIPCDVNKFGPNVRGAVRLGRLELGPYYNEEQMPERIRYILEHGARLTTESKIGLDGKLLRLQRVANEMTGLVAVLAQCSAQDNDVSHAYYCHPDVTNVFRLAGEGGFCGYRNIQNLISYIRDARAEGHTFFPGRLPSVFDIQDMIESAWDRGYNEVGRTETGGIRGTRKFIGTPEAEALLRSCNIGCTATAITEAKMGVSDRGGADVGYMRLLRSVKEYFRYGCTAGNRKISRTSLGPLYFQHPGHSMTIVGLEERKDGTCNLVVFDPMYKPSPLVSKLVGEKFRISYPGRVLKAHRRGADYLRRHRTFELLSLTAGVPPKHGWQGS